MEQEKERAQWGSSLEFILTVIGYAVGLGNVWRFPFLVFKNGGSAFLIPFFVMLFLVGIPIFFMEIAIGQFSALSPSHCFLGMAPLFQGLGYAAILINCFIGFYYNIIIAYCIYYLVLSVRTELPWKSCGAEIDCFQKTNLSASCIDEKEEYYLKNITSLRSPSEVYFYDKVLEITNGIENLGGLNIQLTICLFFAWLIVFLALSKGIKSLGKISYFTATFPYIMLTILVVKGALLHGSDIGVDFYVGKFIGSKLFQPDIWKDATVQVFYALSACTGGLISMSSFSSFNNDIVRDAFLVPILDCLTGFYSGFAIFTVLGHMYLTKCVDSFAEVAAQGPELAFVVYPEGISLMGSMAPLFSFLFFIMMLALGFGSEFSIMESVLSTVIDLLHKYINTKRKILYSRLIVILMFFLFGLTMTTRGGLFVLNLIDTVIAGYPLLIVGLLEVIVVPWVYGTDRFIRDIECMIGTYPRWFWNIWIYLWKFICPFVLITIIVATIIKPSAEMNLKGIPYPTYAKVIGWIIVSIPLSVVPLCGFFQAKKHNYNWKALLNPTEAYYRNYRKHLAQQEAQKANNREISIVNEDLSDDLGKDNQAYQREVIELKVTDSASNNITVF